MMVYGRSPFQHINNHFMKLQCIMDPAHQIDFPPINDVHLLDVIKVCDNIFFLKSVKPNLRRNFVCISTRPQLLLFLGDGVKFVLYVLFRSVQ